MLIVDNKNLWEKIEILEKKYDKEISDIFDVLRTLLIQQDASKVSCAYPFGGGVQDFFIHDII